jgi:hypothetical protein
MSLAPFGHRHSTTRLFLFGLFVGMTGMLIGYVLGEANAYRHANQIAIETALLMAPPPAPPMEIYHVVVNATSNASTNGEGNTATANVIVPDTITLQKEERLDLDGLGSLFDGLGMDDLHDPMCSTCAEPYANTPWSDATDNSRPEIWPGQVTSLDQLVVGMCASEYHEDDPWGPFQIISEPYVYDLGFGENDLFVETLRLANGHEYVLDMSLADVGVIPYPNGRWNLTNRLMVEDCPPPPAPQSPMMLPQGKFITAN